MSDEVYTLTREAARRLKAMAQQADGLVRVATGISPMGVGAAARAGLGITPVESPDAAFQLWVELASTTIAAGFASGARTVTPASMFGIVATATLLVDTVGSGVQETVTVTSVTPTTFTATFAQSHGANTPVVVTSANAQGRYPGQWWLRDAGPATPTWTVQTDPVNVWLCPPNGECPVAGMLYRAFCSGVCADGYLEFVPAAPYGQLVKITGAADANGLYPGFVTQLSLADLTTWRNSGRVLIFSPNGEALVNTKRYSAIPVGPLTGTIGGVTYNGQSLYESQQPAAAASGATGTTAEGDTVVSGAITAIGAGAAAVWPKFNGVSVTGPVAPQSSPGVFSAGFSFTAPPALSTDDHQYWDTGINSAGTSTPWFSGGTPTLLTCPQTGWYDVIASVLFHWSSSGALPIVDVALFLSVNGASIQPPYGDFRLGSIAQDAGGGDQTLRIGFGHTLRLFINDTVGLSAQATVTGPPTIFASGTPFLCVKQCGSSPTSP
jgi:hypothetical protein